MNTTDRNFDRPRGLTTVIPGQETSDGAGVRLRRSIGSGMRLDPFLMLDEFGTENPDDYIAGFPPHPHRGFETVTYMIDGHMRHEDHLGNVGELRSGGVQWMTAGHGVIHSEMPQQESGRMRGFQLWINLPAKEKLKPASYRDIPAQDIPVLEVAEGVRMKLIAGRQSVGDQEHSGPINPQAGAMATDPQFVDLDMAAGATHAVQLTQGHNAFVYAYEGEVSVHGETLSGRQAGVLGDGDHVVLVAGPDGARVIIVAGRPLREPVVQYGPFVMNTREEIEQALADYRDGTLTG